MHSAPWPRTTLARTFSDFHTCLSAALREMDVQHIDDPARRERLLKEVIRLRAPSTNYAESVVRLDVIATRALDDLDGIVRETFEKDIEGGAQLMQWAFAGLPPVSGVAADAVRQRIMNEIRSIQTDIANRAFRRDAAYALDSIAARIRQNAIKPFMEKKAMIMRQQTFFQFPNVEERNAFLSWAISAGKLKNQAQFKCADSLDYWRVGDLDEKKFPFLQTPILTSDGITVRQNDAMRRQLMAEAKRLTELTQPRYPYKVERNQLEGELMELGPGPEFNAKNARHERLDSLMHDSEIEQTETKTDAQIVELVENAIRDNPKDFPLLTKYYLNAE